MTWGESTAYSSVHIQGRREYIAWLRGLARSLGKTRAGLLAEAVERLADESGYPPPPARVVEELESRPADCPDADPTAEPPPVHVDRIRGDWAVISIRGTDDYIAWLGRLSEAAGRTRPETIEYAVRYYARVQVGFRDPEPPRLVRRPAHTSRV